MPIGQTNSYALTQIEFLTDESLIDLLADWNVPVTTAEKYLKQLKIYDRKAGAHFLTLGMENEDEGYELRNLYVSDYLGTRDISFIRGHQVKPSNIHVFFDMRDFLAVVSRYPQERFVDDAIILHSMSLLQMVPPYLYQYNYRHLYSWMENNHNGRMARSKLNAFCAAEPCLSHQPQNTRYAKYETIRDYYRSISQPTP
jgi:hypothetical protein